MPSKETPKNKPTRPTKVRTKKPAPRPSPPEGDDIANPTSFDTNKYAPKERIGAHLSGKKIKKVGLGGLISETNYGNSNV